MSLVRRVALTFAPVLAHQEVTGRTVHQDEGHHRWHHTRGRRPGDPRISIVIPTLNEARNLEVLLPQLPHGCEIVVVDGRSTDDTLAVVRRLAPGATVVQQTRRGKGNALVCGFAAVTGDIVVTLDADCSADPGEIPRFVDALRAGADFAKGSRYRPGGGSDDLTRLRRAGNWVLNHVCNAVLETGYTDLCYGYNAFWADVVPLLHLPDPDLRAPASGRHVWGDGFEIETLITTRVAQAGLTVTEVPSHELLRQHGASNLNAFGDGVRVLRTIATECRIAPSSGVTEPAPTTRVRPVGTAMAVPDPVEAH